MARIRFTRRRPAMIATPVDPYLAAYSSSVSLQLNR